MWMIPLHLQVNKKNDDDDGGFVSWSVSLCSNQKNFSHVRMGLSGLNQY